MFAGVTLVLDLACDRKELNEVKQLVESLHGKVELVINKATKLLVTNAQQWFKQTTKAKFAQKNSIPIVDKSYLYLCQTKGKLLPPKNYPPCAEIVKDESSTSIEETKFSLLKGKFMQRPRLVCPSVEPIPYDSKNDVGYFIAQNHFFLQVKGSNTLFHALELHIHESVLRASPNQLSYKIYEELGTIKMINGNKSYSTRHIRVVDDIVSAELLYESIYSSLIKKGYQLAKIVSPKIGSDLIKSSLTGFYSGGVSFLPGVTQTLVSSIFQASFDKLYEKVKLIPNSDGVLHNSFGTISLFAVEKAESILAVIEKHLVVSSLNPDIAELEKKYSSLTLQQPISLRTLEDIDNQREICSLVRDVSISGEGLINSSMIDSKYRSLGCRILQTNPDEFKLVEKFVNENIKSLDLPRITNVFHLDKNGEYGSFQDAKTRLLEGNNDAQLLFHGSAKYNLLGILSRGMLMPQVSDRLKGARRDYGKLGAGIYFSPSAEAAIYYSDSNPQATYSNTKGYFFICEVLLGNIYVTENEMPQLISPPDGYHSTHGKRSGRGSFKDDEYCIYHTSQQRLKYLVEFDYNMVERVLPEVVPVEVNVEEICSNVMKSERAVEEEEETEEAVISQIVRNDQVYGLLGNDGGQFPLRVCHIRGNLLDVIGKVNLFQEYYNSQQQSVEANYVFPIDAMSAVCGFEAYINGKHVVGEVKEKLQAQKEYKEAIEAGHGAYLMDRDEDSPEVWTVSVGNIPPQATVLIKITYITELQIQGDDILFYLPTNISSSTVDRNLLDAAKASSYVVPTTLELGIDMPFSIKDIKSPSHEDSLIIKVTEAKAMIKLNDRKYVSFEGKDFVLSVTLEDAHKPRMWLENNIRSTAAMLVFYPEFEFTPSLDYEIIFLIDRSFSMGANSTHIIKQAINAAVSNLPHPAYLNCIAFGSYTERLFTRSYENSVENVAKLTKFIHELPTNLGGSDLFAALQQIYLTADRNRAARAVFLLSDGYYHDCDKKLLPFIRQHADTTRVFTFGVPGSDGVSRYVLQSIAHAGCGSFELLENDGTREQLVVNQLYRSLQPTIRDISVDWKNARSVVQAPHQIPNVFSGERQIVYGIIDSCTYADLVSKGADGELFSCRVSTTPDRHVRTDYIHKLAARAMIRDFEEGRLSDTILDDYVEKYLQKGKIIELSCKYNVACSLTSFIAVEHRTPEEQKAINEGKIHPTVQGPPLIELLNNEKIDPLPELAWGSGVKEMRKRMVVEYVKPKEPIRAAVLSKETSKRTESDAPSSLDELLAEIGKSLGQQIGSTKEETLSVDPSGSESSLSQVTTQGATQIPPKIEQGNSQNQVVGVNIIQNGWLYHEELVEGSLSTWKKRWSVLTLLNLQTFRSTHVRVAIHNLPLASIEELAYGSSIINGKAFAFSCTTRRGVVRLAAESEEARELWISLLRNVIPKAKVELAKEMLTRKAYRRKPVEEPQEPLRVPILRKSDRSDSFFPSALKHSEDQDKRTFKPLINSLNCAPRPTKATETKMAPVMATELFAPVQQASYSSSKPVERDRKVMEMKKNRRISKLALFAPEEDDEFVTPLCVSHSIHVSFDSDSGFTGLPLEWEAKISSSGITRQEVTDHADLVLLCLTFDDKQNSDSDVLLQVADYLELTNHEPNALYHLQHTQNGHNILDGMPITHTSIPHSRCSLNVLRWISFAQSSRNNIFPTVLDCFFYESKVIVVTNSLGVCLDDILCAPELLSKITEDVIAYICSQLLLFIIQLIENGLVYELLSVRQIYANSLGEISFGFPNNMEVISETPPEIIKGEPMETEKAFVYAVGMVMYNLMVGEPPLLELPPLNSIFRVLKCGIPFPAVNKFSDSAFDFYSSCTQPDPSKRRSVKELLFVKIHNLFFSIHNVNKQQ